LLKRQFDFNINLIQTYCQIVTGKNEFFNERLKLVSQKKEKRLAGMQALGF
jgi:hypothetical protein